MEDKIRQRYPKAGLIAVNAFHDKLVEYGIYSDLDDLKRIFSMEDSYTVNKMA